MNTRVRIGTGLLLIGLTCLLQPPQTWTVLSLASYQGSLFAYASEILLILGIFGLAVLAPMLAAFASPPWKWSLFALFAISIIANLVFYRASGQTMTYTDWAILWQARANIGDAVDQYYSTLLKCSAATTPLLIGYWLVPSSRQRIWPWALGVSTLSIAVFAGLCVIWQGGNTGLFPRTTSLHGMLVSTIFDRPMGKYNYVTDRRPDKAPVADHIALVIDESVSHEFFAQVVGPQIAARGSGWRVYDFGFATSMANCSMASNIMLRKLVSIDSVAEDLYRNPLVWSLAHNAGFSTWLIDAQQGGFGHNLFDDTERSLINEMPPVPGSDADIIDKLHAAWSQTRTLSLVLKKGAHFPYEKRHPAQYKSDSSALSIPYVQANDRRARYVNAVDFQTGGFFRRLMEFVPNARTVVFYTSDHGQNIKDGPGFPHCNSTSVPDVNEGIVPLLVLANFDMNEFAEAAARNRNRVSQFDLVHTLRDFLGYESGQITDRGLLRTAGDPVPGFVYKSPFGFFGRPVEILPVDRSAYLRRANERWGKAP